MLKGALYRIEHQNSNIRSQGEDDDSAAEFSEYLALSSVLTSHSRYLLVFIVIVQVNNCNRLNNNLDNNAAMLRSDNII